MAHHDVRLLRDDAQADAQQEAAQDQDEEPDSGRRPGPEHGALSSLRLTRRPLTLLSAHLHPLRRADSQELGMAIPVLAALRSTGLAALRFTGLAALRSILYVPACAHWT